MTNSFWRKFYDLGKAAGAKFPELLAAQAALESGWGENVSGKNNYFGIKGSPGTVVTTREVYDGKEVMIKAEFKDFANELECVQYLVDRWYKDYLVYKGINRAGTAQEAAYLLKEEGYATDPVYPELLIGLMDEHLPEKGEQEYFLDRAAEYYNGEPHQTAAWRALEGSLASEQLEAFKAAYSPSKTPAETPQPSKSRFPLDVPYFSQLDSTTGHAERSCFSSAMAMAIAYIDPDAFDGDDDDYLRIVFVYGDTVSADAQLAAARSLGMDVKFKTNGSEEDLIKQLDLGVPIPVGILHKGPVSNPSGGGHYVTLIGYDDTHFWVHDPFGQLDLINGNYTIDNGAEAGRNQRYTRKNLMARWLIDGSGKDGWWMKFS